MDKPFLSKYFLLILVAAVLYACYVIYRPFLVWFLIAAILTTIFYPWYLRFLAVFRTRRVLASFALCLTIFLLVITPAAGLVFYAVARIADAIPVLTEYVNRGNIADLIQTAMQSRYFGWVTDFGVDLDTIKENALPAGSKALELTLFAGKAVIGQTANFIISIPIILFMMFFFFIDGERILDRIMHLTPLPDKYDRIIFEKFRAVSYSTVVSTFATAAAQGLIAAIGFLIVGLPAFFPGIAMGILSLLPYAGAAIVWFPAGVYLLVTGQIWQGVFIMIWGAVLVSMVDNVIRTFLIQGKAQVHPLFILFAIIGGISLFGFWGVIFGPLIVALAVTILHIYELEYGEVLEK